MTNAAQEILEHINKVAKTVKHIKVYLDNDEILYEGPYTIATILALDFDYDSGYGGQELFGHIWYADGTWSNRGEYDGSEWWELVEPPTY